jgi:RimJ/RimL family protein N-acetyltransferase
MTTPLLNAYGQPIGAPVPGWTAPPAPARDVITGRFCELRPLDVSSAEKLFDAFSLDEDDREWTYLPYGPFETRDAFRAWVKTWAVSDTHVLFTIHSGEDRHPTGIAGYLHILPATGSIEVGHLRFSRLLQRTPAATEAMYLMMRRAFDLGYRRYEWKCDAFNDPSRRAATRLGFSFEGIFRQATVYKGRTRDTAWFSVIDAEWPALRQTFQAWLDPSNFDDQGRQKQRLGDIRAASRV